MADGTKGRAPAFQFYARDFLTDEDQACMSPAAAGIYIRLLCHAWLKGSIPANVKQWSTLASAPLQVVEDCRDEILMCWVALEGNPDRLVNRRLEREREQQAINRKKRQNAGRLGGLASAQAKVKQSSSNAEPMLKQTSTTASATATASSESKQSTGADAPASKKRPLKVKPPKPPTTDHSRFKAWWLEEFESCKGVAYGYQGGKDGAAIKAVLGMAGSLEVAKARASALLTSTDPFFEGKGVDLGMLRSQWNRLGSAKAGVSTAPRSNLDRNMDLLREAAAKGDSNGQS